MAGAKKFGTFAGVFTPSILTILGVIMYLRLPTIVGQAGLWTTIAIIVVAHIISVATGLSVASIATDKKVQAGGTYFMLSRSIGLPIGGTLGLALFVGLSFSVSLYVIGFSESFLGYWGWEISKSNIRLAGTITLLTVTGVTLISTALALKTQFFILAAIVLSLLSIFFGNHNFAPSTDPAAAIPQAVPFIVLFGIFFPAVTGFEAGVSMSGDLKDPKKSIPTGTIWAILVGLVVYIGLATYFYYTVDANQLVNNPTILLDISLFAPAVVAGIWGATISSALGSILGAPRILQATASDRIVHPFFARGYGKENEPRHALILTFLIAEAGILIGELDVIARVVSMFFITTYGFLNLSCFIESWASPDFRPQFRIPKVVSLIGTIACFVVMIQLDFVAMIGATILLGMVFLYLKRKELTLDSGDTWEGFWSSVLRSGLQRLSRQRIHERNWRPNVLLFSTGSHAREHMLAFGSWLVHKRGLLSNFDLSVEAKVDRLQPRSSELIIDSDGVETGIFSRKVASADPFDTMESIAAYHGFSGVEPNAVILGWAAHKEHPEGFTRLLRRFVELDLSILLLKVDKERGFGARKTIDVWWRGENNNISLTLALLRFLTGSYEWTGVSIRVLVINEGDTAFSEAIQSRMDGILDAYRITAQTVVVNNSIAKKPTQDIIGYESGNTDLTIVGMPSVSNSSAESYVANTSVLLSKLGTTLLVDASSFFNELSVGIETTASLPEPEAEELADLEPLPELALPADETIRWALQNASKGLQEASDEFVLQSLAAASELPLEMGREFQLTIKRTFASLARTVEKQDRPRARRSIGRAQAVLAHQAQEIVATYKEEQLPLENKVLEAAVVKLRSSLRNLIRQTPEELSLAASTGADGESAVRRLASRTERTARFRDRFEAKIDVAFYREVTSTLRNHGSVVSELYESILVQIRNAFDALARLAERVETDSFEGESLSEELARIESELESVIESSSDRLRVVGHTLRVDSRRLMQEVADELVAGGARRLRSGSEQDAVAATLLGAPGSWTECQQLLLNRLHLGVQLIGFRNRLVTIEERHQENVGIAIQNGVLKPLNDILQSLQEDSLAAVDADVPIRTIDAFQASFGTDSLYDSFAADVRSAIEEMPESVRTLPEATVESVVRDPLEDTNEITVSLRRVIDYTVKMELLGPVQEELAKWPVRIQKASNAAQDILRLVTYPGDDSTAAAEDAQTLEARAAVLSKGTDRIRVLLDTLTSDATALIELMNARVQAASQRLNQYTLTRTEGDLQRYVRGETGRQIQSGVARARQNVRSFVRDQFVRLLYRRSEGVLLARQFQESDPYLGSLTQKALDLVDRVAPNPDVLHEIPLFYRQLFLDFPNITEEFWVGADAQLRRGETAVGRWRNGRPGGLMVVGESGSGKTALCQIIAWNHFKRNAVFHLRPPAGGSIDVDAFVAGIRRALGVQGAMETWAGQLPAECALVIDDLEQWWERSPGGTAVLERLVDLIADLDRRCFVLANANVHSLRLIDRIYPITSQFLDVIARGPSNAEQIKEIITLRHRSAGLNYIVDGQVEEAVSEWRSARLFTDLFDISRGNVGVALQAWIASIKKVTGNGLEIGAIRSVDLDPVVASASSIQKAITVHVLLHGAISLERLRRSSGLDEALLQHELQGLQRLGWIRVDGGIVAVDRFVRPHLTNKFAELRLIG